MTEIQRGWDPRTVFVVTAAVAALAVASGTSANQEKKVHKPSVGLKEFTELTAHLFDGGKGPFP
jgi:hypothetical protein